jgi:hypothetical protein
MRIGIIDREPLGQGGGVEFGVSGNQCQRPLRMVGMKDQTSLNAHMTHAGISPTRLVAFISCSGGGTFPGASWSRSS